MSAKIKRKQTEALGKPASHIQVGGVRIAIWRNEGEGGPYFKAGEPELSYKRSDGQWHTAKSYGLRDLVNLIKAASLAHSEVLRFSHAEEASTEESGDE